VLTVYDMIIERFPHCFDRRFADGEIARKRAAIESAAAIIAISDATSRDLRSLYPSTADRIATVHLGHEHLRRSDQPRTMSSPLPPGLLPPFALYVGDRAGYKNFRVILEAMTDSAWPREVRLAVAGPRWRDEELDHLAKRSLLTRVTHLGRTSDAVLTQLYQSASCVLVPALIEGFGLPVIEAHAAAAPLVCSDTEVFREIAGDAALFFDPERPDALAARVAEVINQDVARTLRDRGRANLSRFRWPECARLTWEVYLKTAQRP
jgi:glycosyltransferase involved in cell wall biosynthesis